MMFTKADVAYLKSLGEDEWHIRQIERAVQDTVFEYRDKRISRNRAIELLGRERFLSGMQRSAFHRTAVRDTKDGDGETVLFDSSKFFL